MIYKQLIKISRYILLWLMNNKLKRYKRDAAWYHKQGAQPNWYDEKGIPELENEILMLETTIKLERG